MLTSVGVYKQREANKNEQRTRAQGKRDVERVVLPPGRHGLTRPLTYFFFLFFFFNGRNFRRSLLDAAPGNKTSRQVRRRASRLMRKWERLIKRCALFVS